MKKYISNLLKRLLRIFDSEEIRYVNLGGGIVTIINYCDSSNARFSTYLNHCVQTHDLSNSVLVREHLKLYPPIKGLEVSSIKLNELTITNEISEFILKFKSRRIVCLDSELQEFIKKN